jgi:hypothetical protein
MSGRLLQGLAALVLLSGCSSMSVTTDFSEATDFSAFRTFQYKETDYTLAGTNRLAHQRIVEATRQEMIAQGFEEVDTDPDVYVSYYGSVSEEIVLNTMHMGYGFGSRWHRHHSSMTQSTTMASTFLTGTLIIDIWRAAEKELVWRGQVSESLSDDPDRNSDTIDRGIRAVFEQFPPPTPQRSYATRPLVEIDVAAVPYGLIGRAITSESPAEIDRSYRVGWNTLSLANMELRPSARAGRAEKRPTR